MGTYHILEYARSLDCLDQFVYFSTDEVFGPEDENTLFKEWDRYNCTNPYSATKAGGEELVLAYANTFKIPVLVTHTMNLFGERQYPEKFIPLIIKSILSDKEVTIHCDQDLEKPGSRFYMHCQNMADALSFLLHSKTWQRDKVNIVGEKEVSNLYLAQTIAEIMGEKLLYKMVDFHSSRPGHDLRYSLDGSYLSSLGWSQPLNFESSLESTVSWFLDNKKWLLIDDN